MWAAVTQQQGVAVPPEQFNWQARFNLSVDGGTGDVLAGFNTLRPITPITSGEPFTGILDTDGNELTGVSVTVTGTGVVAETSTGPLAPQPELYNHRWRNNGAYHFDFAGLDDTKRYRIQILTQELGATEGQIISTFTYVAGTTTLMGTISRDASMSTPSEYDFLDDSWVRFDEIKSTTGAFRMRVQRNGSLARAVVHAIILTEYDVVIDGVQTLNTAGATASPLPYISYVPNGGAPTKPAFIFLHGSGERGNGTSQLPNAMKFGVNYQVSMGTFNRDAFAFSPQITTANYWSGNTVNLYNFIEYLLGEYPIDPTRVYLVGFSDGCIGVGTYTTYTAAAKIAASVCIGYDPSYHEGGVRPDIDINEIAKMPCWVFGNTNDPVTDIADTIAGVSDVNAVNPGIEKLTVFNDYNHENAQKVLNGTGMGTNISTTYDPFDQDVYDWLLTHTL